jgi:hypothetical protein
MNWGNESVNILKSYHTTSPGITGLFLSPITAYQCNYWPHCFPATMSILLCYHSLAAQAASFSHLKQACTSCIFPPNLDSCQYPHTSQPSLTPQPSQRVLPSAAVFPTFTYPIGHPFASPNLCLHSSKLLHPAIESCQPSHDVESKPPLFPLNGTWKLPPAATVRSRSYGSNHKKFRSASP